MARRRFAGKTVVITGAARGLGRALCERFGRAGAVIGGVDVDAATLAATASDLRAAGVEVATAVCDLRDEPATWEVFGTLREALGPVDVLIANAGVTRIRRFDAGEAAAVRRVTEVNFFGAVHATAAAFDDLVARRGLIVAISSVAGYSPLVGRAGYSASKHAVHGFFDTLRAELSGRVDVLVVCPSSIATGLRAAEADGSAVGAEDAPEAVAGQIFAAACRGRRLLATGRLGRAARALHRLSPRLYEALMRRATRDV